MIEIARGEAGVVTITLCRPERRNALDHAAFGQLLDAVEAVRLDTDARVLVLRGAGPSFCAGADLLSANRAPVERPRTGHIHRSIVDGPHRALRVLWDVPVPVVAAVQGHAAGFGCGLALVADVVVAAESARFSMPMARSGFTPDSMSTWLLPRLVGVARAKRMLVRGLDVDAATAHGWGLVDELVTVEEFDDRVQQVVAELAGGATVAIGLTKWAIHAALEGGVDTCLATEALLEEVAMRSPDFKEGVAAFTEQRPPRFSGR